MENNIIITEEERPIWQIIIAALLYATLFYFLFEIGKLYYESGFTKRNYDISLIFLNMSGYVFVTALGFSVKINYYFNLENKKYKKQFQIGLIRYGIWKKLPELEYVSVFYYKSMYEVNMWYVKNQKFKMYEYSDDEQAFYAAKMICRKLKIKLLDATKKNNFKWVDTN